jgi:hypothetical protein
MGEHLVAFHELPPSFAQGMHFSPGGQSWLITSHSMSEEPPSEKAMKTPSVVSIDPVSVQPVCVPPVLEVLLPPLLPPLDPPPPVALLLDALLLPEGEPPEPVVWSLPAERVGRAQPASTVRSGSTTPGAGRPCMFHSLY